MAKSDQNITMFAGDSKNLVVTVLNDSGGPIDLTGAVIKWIMYRNNVGADVTKSSLNGGITISDPLSGVFTISVLSADTSDLAGSFNHAAQVTDARGFATVVMNGRVTINQMRKFQ